MLIAPGIHRVGSNPIVNAYLLEEGGAVTVIDAGMPGLYRALPAELAAMSRSLADVRALLLTHGHSDHVGFAERLRSGGVPVSVHEADAALARGEVPNDARQAGPLRPAPILNFLWFSLRQGGLRRPAVGAVATFGDGATLDVPGSPRVIVAPGHTAGSACLHLGARSTLFVGDALCTYAVTSGRRGPQLSPFNADRGQALNSLERLHGVDARLVLPGHGEAWADGIDEAVRLVRERA